MPTTEGEPASGNWFVALPVPPLAWFDALVTEPPAGLRSFHRDDLHLTVAFLGRVDEAAGRRALAAVRWPLRPQRVTLGEVVAMGNARHYSALSALLEDGRTAIEAAITATRDAAFSAAGATPELRPAKAHVTLARPQRRATSAQRAAGLRWARSLRLLGTEMVLDRLALYTRAEAGNGRRFTMVATVGLGQE